MIIKFSHLGIKARDYNGINAHFAIALIINEAIDYLMCEHFCNMVELDTINAKRCTVDFGNETVRVYTVMDTFSFLKFKP